MKIISYSTFKRHLENFITQAASSGTPLLIKQQKGEDVVLMSKSDYEGIQETLHLLSSPKNAQRLKEAIDEYNSSIIGRNPG